MEFKYLVVCCPN